MKLGNPIKTKIRVSERHGHFVVSTDTMEIVAPTLRSARRLGVVLRRIMAHSGN